MEKLKNISRIDYDLHSIPTVQDISTSALMRIADATELMSKNYVELQNDLTRYKRYYSEYVERVKQRDKTIINLKGQVTKLKNKLAVTSINADNCSPERPA